MSSGVPDDGNGGSAGGDGGDSDDDNRGSSAHAFSSPPNARHCDHARSAETCGKFSQADTQTHDLYEQEAV